MSPQRRPAEPAARAATGAAAGDDPVAAALRAAAARPPTHPALGRVGAVVVTHNTGPAGADRVTMLAGLVEGVVVVDNGSDPGTVAALETAAAGATPAHVTLVRNADNRGLAAAQNQGLALLLAAGFDWLLLMDDDSEPAGDMLAAMARVEAARPGAFGLLAPRLTYPGSSRIPRYLIEHGWRARWTTVPVDGLLEDPVFVIASGSLIRATALRAAGGMRADFFIDYVDVEFCFRLRAAGWRLAVVGAADLAHTLGRPSRHRLLGRTIWTSNHSAFRCHAMARNRSRLWRGWWRAHPGWTMLDMVMMGYQILRVALFETDRATKTGAMLRGLWAGLVRLPPARGTPPEDQGL